MKNKKDITVNGECNHKCIITNDKTCCFNCKKKCKVQCTHFRQKGIQKECFYYTLNMKKKSEISCIGSVFVPLRGYKFKISLFKKIKNWLQNNIFWRFYKNPPGVQSLGYYGDPPEE